MVPITCNAVGDIIALVQLACQIVTALNESRGARASCRELLAQLTSIANLLRVSQTAIDSLRDESLRKIVDAQLAMTTQCIEEALNKIAQFPQLLPQPTTSRYTLGDRARTAWSSVKWELLGKADANACLDRVGLAFEPLTFALPV